MSEKLVVWLDAHTRAFAEYFGGRRVDMNTILERVAAYEGIGPPSDLIRPVRCGECVSRGAAFCMLGDSYNPQTDAKKYCSEGAAK